MRDDEHTFAVKPLATGQYYVTQTSGRVRYQMAHPHTTYVEAATRAEELARMTGFPFAVLRVMGVVERRVVQPQYDVQWK